MTKKYVGNMEIQEQTYMLVLAHLHEQPMQPGVHPQESAARATEIMPTCLTTVNGESIAVDRGICLKPDNM